jgi:phosphoglycolate phosphatase-like HAD superfamily hydrolase
MKNANVFVDVDMTLVDANGRMFPGVPEALSRLREKGCHLFLWSTHGADYARTTAQRLGLLENFEGFAAKPDIVIDDMPATVMNPFLFDVNQEESWPALAEIIIRKHID